MEEENLRGSTSTLIIRDGERPCTICIFLWILRLWWSRGRPFLSLSLSKLFRSSENVNEWKHLKLSLGRRLVMFLHRPFRPRPDATGTDERRKERTNNSDRWKKEGNHQNHESKQSSSYSFSLPFWLFEKKRTSHEYGSGCAPVPYRADASRTLFSAFTQSQTRSARLMTAAFSQLLGFSFFFEFFFFFF